MNCLVLFYNLYIKKYWQGLYFSVSIISWIHAKIKSSQIKSVLQYPLKSTKALKSRDRTCWETSHYITPFTSFAPCYMLNTCICLGIGVVSILEELNWMKYSYFNCKCAMFVKMFKCTTKLSGNLMWPPRFLHINRKLYWLLKVSVIFQFN